MRRLLPALIAFFVGVSAHAQTISALPPASGPLSGSEFVPIVQNGVTKRATSDLFLGTTYNPNSVAITGGTISGVTLAATSVTSTPAASTFGRAWNSTQSGPAGSVAGANSAYAFGGQAGFSYNYFNGSDAANVTGTNPTYAALVSIGLLTGGSTSQGTKIGLNVQLDHDVASSPSAPRDHIALNSWAYGEVSDGGTGTTAMTAAGSLFGTGFGAQARSGAVNLFTVSGGEVDTQMETGSSSYTRMGWSSVDGGQVQGSSVYDTAFEVGSAGGPGWKNGFLLSSLHGSAPLSSGGCAFCTDGVSQTIATGMDLSAYTITGNFLAGPGFSVSGTGVVSALTGGAGGYKIGTKQFAKDDGSFVYLYCEGGTIQCLSMAPAASYYDSDVQNFRSQGGTQYAAFSGSGFNLALGVYSSGASNGVTCSGSPTSSFASTGGIVTHC